MADQSRNRPFVARGAALVALLGLAFSSILSRGAGAAEKGLVVTRDQQNGTITVIVPTTDGYLDWDDVSRGLARAGRFNEVALREEIGEGTDLTSRWSRMGLRTLSATIPDVKLHVVEHVSSGKPALKIRLDKADSRRKIRRLKSAIRDQFPAGREAYGLRLDDDWDRQPGQLLVVLVHGYGGGHHSLEGLHEELNEQGFGCATFAYPNDGPLADAAELLADELEDFHDENPKRRLAFVTHSMGGLVVRAVIEEPDFEEEYVERLIMVCPPNHGSPWTQIPGGLECWEYLRAKERARLPDAFHTSVSDGLNEARHDLRPGSPFLRKLNALDRNSNVRYSIILGTGAPFTAEELVRCQEHATRALAESGTGRFVMPRVDSLFADVRNVAAGRGDGVVSIASGKLDGVGDVLLLPMSHGAATGALDAPVQQRLLEAVLDRLPAGMNALSTRESGLAESAVTH